MKRITFSADAAMVEAARERARAEGATLGDAFRRWLQAYARPEDRAEKMMDVIRDLQGRVSTGGRRFTRDERTER